MGDHHDEDGDGVADHLADTSCDGENRADPSSWGDPERRGLGRPTRRRARRIGQLGRCVLMWLDDLADAARGSGLPVWEDPGWRRRDHGAMAGVKGIICHHTGSSGSGAWTVVRDGRADLAGPLAQLTLERDGSVRVLSHGQAWHAGTGSWPSIGRNVGNAYCIGIEAVYNGSDITDAQRRAYPQLCAALARRYRIPVGNVIGHREWAPTRKVDPGRIDMPAFRREVAALVGGGTPAPAPAPSREEFLMALSDAEQRELLQKTREVHAGMQLPSWWDRDKAPWPGSVMHAVAVLWNAVFFASADGKRPALSDQIQAVYEKVTKGSA